MLSHRVTHSDFRFNFWGQLFITKKSEAKVTVDSNFLAQRSNKHTPTHKKHP